MRVWSSRRSGCRRPEEITLAHNGVLLLDELRNFTAAFSSSLRQPLEEQATSIPAGPRGAPASRPP